MRLVFADPLYWGAILHPPDQYRGEVIRAREALGHARLVATYEVLLSARRRPIRNRNPPRRIPMRMKKNSPLARIADSVDGHPDDYD